MSDVAIATPRTRLQNFLDRAGFGGFPWKTATILYTISWGWLFIVRDSLWVDDWTMYADFDIFPWRDLGFAPWASISVRVAQVVGLSSVRGIVFICFFASAILLYGISSKFWMIDRLQRSLLVLLFLLLPFNAARVALFSFFYTTSYLLFFTAWYLLLKGGKHLYYICLILFFLSFQMHSLLAFYLIPVVHLLLISNVKHLYNLFLVLRAKFLLVILPLIYWSLRSIFWPEKIKYHDVSFSRAISALPFVVAVLIVCGGLGILYKKTQATTHKNILILLSGSIAMAMGMLAYVIYGFFTINRFIFFQYFHTLMGRSDWYSRHQSLQPLGFALLIVGLISVLPRFLTKFTSQIQVSILAVCVVFNIGFGFEYVTDHSKQKEVISVLKEEIESEYVKDYQFVDQTIFLNARGRTYRERDWKGLIWLAHGVEAAKSSRFATTCEPSKDARLVLIKGPVSHWQAFKNWVGEGDMGFDVSIDDTPGACKPEMVRSEKVSGAIPILFYFTGAKN